MIELVSESRCIKCNICVKVCPTNVFDKVVNGPPIIARQNDCQTCFMCELYCPVDALYVAPEVDPLAQIDEKFLEEAALLGSYRKNIGWTELQRNTSNQDSTYLIIN
ncbi:ferredoxin family protein [Cylindrospermopsis raciborskii]|uniref:4Fe-4S ferredoxin n=1 Tax=Cylindrospermopsis raciborskii CENA303 TaxID=1170769 RepID=A0A1X4G472_9CYAN|nr:ferredoxin family protein [Cylindrospermopsis raciborskii]EFA72193.1 4Fe-4S ferredoxin, iron-sulfur binding [Raphidiopsis brookii D9]MCZ2201299.1 ferredoxin family protein [Cylindrospermopsis raciborskii PAMP2012]MCZ2206226.1 ferredoxin family protein [Cylindrospermopsis raciborskii PAMP2011]OSO89227.1 4Fe-4S ferredoxin [Cylindrospermopsis raciborskii CENA303]